MARENSQIDGSQDLEPREPDYVVGYGRPPVASRFKKGQSGNPKGRPRAKKNIATILNEVLHKTVHVRVGDRVQARSKIEAALEVALNLALKGDYRPLLKLIELAKKLGSLEVPQDEITSITRTIIYPRTETQT